MMRTLVVYYSFSENTARVAEAAASTLNADIERIDEVVPRSKILGALSGVYEVLFDKSPEIQASQRDPGAYDLVILGAPVWAARLASPMKSYLERHKGRIARAAYFVCAGGSGVKSALKQYEEFGGPKPAATLFVADGDQKSDAWRRKLAAFAEEVRAAQPVQG